MNTQEFANLITGRSYRNEITKQEEALAKAAGLVVAFGASDDLVELRGAIDDELNAYDGTTFAVTPQGLLTNKCDQDDCPYFAEAMKKAVKVEAIWCEEGSGYSWTFKAPFPHETFDVMEDGEKYCRGIVFRLCDVEVKA